MCNIFLVQVDEVAEWLRRLTANPMDSVRVGTNLILVVDFRQKGSSFDYMMPLPLYKKYACILVKEIVPILIINPDACRPHNKIRLLKITRCKVTCVPHLDQI